MIRPPRKDEPAGAAGKPPRGTISSRMRFLKLLLLDVDGVLTDGGIYYADGGAEMKRFHIQDGMAVDLLQRAGLRVGILTGRVSDLVERRARELGMQVVKQGFYDKGRGLDLILAEEGLREREVGYVGDDLLDLPVMRRVGFRAAPADAVPEVRAAADYVCKRRGGAGAVREVADLILDAIRVKPRLIEEICSPGLQPARGRKPSPTGSSAGG